MLSADRLKAFASSVDLHSDSDNYDDDFEGELQTIKVPGQSMGDHDAQEKTLRPISRRSEKPREPSKSHARHPSRTFTRSNTAPVAAPAAPAKPHTGGRLEPAPRLEPAFVELVEDFSDLQVDHDAMFRNDINHQRRRVRPSPLTPFISVLNANDWPRQGLRQSDAPQLFHPSDLTSLPRSMQPPAASGSVRRQAPSRPSVLPDRPMRRTQSSVEIQKFTEDEEDEDFSDILGPDDVLAEKDESDKGSEEGGLMLMSKLSNNSWLGDDEDEDDPFAMMDPGWDEMDLEANIARDRHARLCERVEELVRSLKSTESEDTLCDLSEDLVSLGFSRPLWAGYGETDGR